MLEHTYKNAVLAAKNLVQMKNNGNFVYAVKDGEVILKPVQILAEDGGSFILKNDFSNGESLITQDIEPQLLGQKVQIQNQPQKEE